MLYNKNSVRKTNDKKILHKVGKQWKVISVALLMAIGGGAAVAATNNANANADANNGIDASTQATINSLEQGPTEGQSSAPASASSKAASASTKAPTMPNPSLNPDPVYNGNNASAEYHRVMQGYDKAVVKYYGGLVNSYVGSVNSKFPSAASNVNSAFASASNTQKTDQSKAASYSAAYHSKDWFAEVSNIAKNKSGIDATDFINNVSASAKALSENVTATSNNISGASSVAYYAGLISEIASNGYNNDVSSEYSAKSYRASINASMASVEYSDAQSVANTYSEESNNAIMGAQSARNDSILNEAQNSAANFNSQADFDTLMSLAKNDNNGSSLNSAQVSTTNEYVSQVASVFAEDNYNNNKDYNKLVNDNNVPGYLKDVLNNAAQYNTFDHEASQASTAYDNLLNHTQASAKFGNSNFNTVNDIVNEYATLSNNAKDNASSVADAETIVNGVNNATGNGEDVTDFVKTNFVNAKGQASASAASLVDKVFGIKADSNNTVKISANVGNFSNGAKTNYKAANVASSEYNAFKGAAAELNNQDTTVLAVSDAASTASVNANVAYQEAKTFDNNTLKANNDAAYQLVSDAAEQQIYGARKSADDTSISNANNNMKSLSAEVSGANSTANSLKGNYNSAKSTSDEYNILGNYPTLNADTLNDLVSSANDFVQNISGSLTNLDMNDDKAVSNAVSGISSAANNAGEDYTKAVSASNSYAKAFDTDFVLASDYAYHYSSLSGSDQSAFNSASAAKSDFYASYTPADFGSDADMVNNYQPKIQVDGALANAYADNVLINEPHVVTVIKKAVLHTNPDYNMKNDHKLGVVPVGTHLKVENVGFDRFGNTRLYVNYNGQHAFITGLRTYVKDSYLTYGVHYKVAFNRNVNVYKSLQFNKGTYVKTLKAGTPVTGTAVRNDPGYYNGLTRLQLDGTEYYVTTLDSTIKSVSQLDQNNTAAPKGAFFYNGQDTTPDNVNL